MKTKIWKAFWNPEKEEKWLNEMAAKGLAMSDYNTFRYTFDDCIPGEYIYRMELLKENQTNPESVRYIRFMEDNGVEYIESYLSWVYFRKKAADGAFEIYSDFDSRIKHYKRISNRFLVTGIAELILAISYIGLFKSALEDSMSLIAPTIGLTFVLLVGALLLRLWWRYAKKVKRLKEERAILE